MRARLVTAVTAAAALVSATLVLGAQPALAVGDPGGNNGTIKIGDELLPEGDAATTAHDPQVDCTFTIRWFGFDEGDGILSEVVFTGQGSHAKADITSSGPRYVYVGGDAAGGGTDLDGEKEYTLSVSGVEPHPVQGYHVKVTVNTAGTHAASKKKSKVIWVKPCPTMTTPAGPTPGGTTPGGTTPGGTETTPPPFSWDWEYDAPTCAGVTVTYPATLPDGQANDVNIRIETDHGQRTLNFHNNDGFWSGSTLFSVPTHPQFPAGASEFHVTWVQVGGTNYHWQGDVGCRGTTGGYVAMTALDFDGGSKVLPRGRSFSETVAVEQSGDADLVLQQLARGSWAAVSTFDIQDGAATVTFPRLTKRGTYRFRLAVAGSEATTGATTGVLTVRVR